MVCDINSEWGSVSEAAKETHSRHTHTHTHTMINTYFAKKRACA